MEVTDGADDMAKDSCDAQCRRLRPPGDEAYAGGGVSVAGQAVMALARLIGRLAVRDITAAPVTPVDRQRGRAHIHAVMLQLIGIIFVALAWFLMR